jgi:hypothetical protein
VLGGALAVAATAQAGILLGCGAAKTFSPQPRPYVLLRRPRRFRRIVLRLCALALGLAALSLAARWHDLALTGKVDLGVANTLWMRIHYASFFLLLALIPAVIVSDQMLEHRPLPPRTLAVLGAFGTLCVLQSERVVALVLLMIPISWLAVRGIRRRARGPVRRRRVGLVQVGAAFAPRPRSSPSCNGRGAASRSGSPTRPRRSRRRGARASSPRSSGWARTCSSPRASSSGFRRRRRTSTA